MGSAKFVECWVAAAGIYMFATVVAQNSNRPKSRGALALAVTIRVDARTENM